MRVYSARPPFYFLAAQAVGFDRRKISGGGKVAPRRGKNTGDPAACYCREKLRTWGANSAEAWGLSDIQLVLISLLDISCVSVMKTPVQQFTNVILIDEIEESRAN